MRRHDLGLNTSKTISPQRHKRRKEDKMDQHAQRMRSYIDALEEEKRKIQAFHRELPLCLELVNNAIDSYRQQWSGTTTECLHGGQSECSEQTSTQGPVLEEFIPIKRPCSGSDDDEDAELEDSDRMPSDVKRTVAVAVGSSDNERKSNWLRSAQLWNQTAPDPPPKDNPPPKRVPVLEVKRSGGGAFQLFKREQGAIVETGHMNKQSLLSLDIAHSTVPVAAARSTADIAAVRRRKEDREPAQPNRKQRRNWSPELHRRFLQALQQIGSSHAATPKQIRELMKVDGLTNDEVKSHLQKYRLHTRTPGTSTIPATGTAQAPQFVVVGGIWVPPAEYPAAASRDSVKAPALYAPAPANSGPQKQPDVSEGKGSHSAGGEEEAGGARSDSPSTSSSSHTTTASRLH